MNPIVELRRQLEEAIARAEKAEAERDMIGGVYNRARWRYAQECNGPERWEIEEEMEVRDQVIDALVLTIEELQAEKP